MMNNKKTKSDLSSVPIISQPENVSEMLLKYGTYEIQPTADSDNDFPKIAQGLPKEENRKVVDKDTNIFNKTVNKIKSVLNKEG